MALSLSSGRGGYGLGIRPMRAAVIAARTKGLVAHGLMHPSVPNMDFVINSVGSTLNVYGADGNQSGTIAPSALIDGTSQTLLNCCKLFSVVDGYFWTFVKNAANEIRLVRAAPNGSITTPGAKFLPAVAGSFNNNAFCYEQGNNIVVRSQLSDALYEFVVSKATGGLVSSQVLISGNSATASGTYITADGTITFSNLRKIQGNDLYVYVGLTTAAGKVFSGFNLSELDVFGLILPSAGTYYPVLSGDYVHFSDVTGASGLNIRLVKRQEFDRWLADIVKKHDFV